MSHLAEMEARCGVPSGHSQSLSDIRDIVRRSAVITGRLAEMEKQTRILESDLTEAWFEAQVFFTLLSFFSSFLPGIIISY